MTVYDVTDAKTGEHVAVFMTDYFPRASKRQGAWMSEFKGSWTREDGTSSRPVIFNVGNFSRPTADTPALLTLDEVETMFHEFGHGLHGMLSRARYKGQAGTNVDRDFVELPSQIHEHWALEPELLRTYAHHYKTGEVIPDELIKKLEASATHNQGFTTAELAGAALLDLQYGKLDPSEDIDIAKFEKDVADKLGIKKKITREVALVETRSWCLLISLGCYRAVDRRSFIVRSHMAYGRRYPGTYRPQGVEGSRRNGVASNI